MVTNNQSGRKLVPIKLDGYKPLRDVVFETLRDAIITQVLKPGERLMEIQLADEMGVSARLCGKPFVSWSWRAWW